MGLRGPVLAATDLSDADDEALRQGHVIASSVGAPVIVCHVLPEAFNVRVLFPQYAGIDTSFQSELQQKAVIAVRNRLSAAVSNGAEVPIEIETGTAHGGILAVAERLGAELIVVGPGTTAQRVARAAVSPVLIARPSPVGGGVLGSTDFSDPSLPALHMGADEATRRGVRFRAVHCIEGDETTYLESAGLPGMIAVWPLLPCVMQELESAARLRLAAALAATHVSAEAIVLRRSPAQGILEASRAVATALIVVGTRGRTGLTRLALSSVAEAVIRDATCSVLVLPLHSAAPQSTSD